MGKKPSKKDRRLLLRWITALTAVLVLMTALAAALGSFIEPSIPSNPYGPTDFGYVGNYLTCLSGESIPGIDVSSHQGDIDWESVKAAGMEFAIIRVGYRSYKDGTLHEDKNARQNLTNAKSAGLKIGAYFFSQALTPEEAQEEAEFALNILKDFELDLPVVYDWEYVSEDVRTGAMEPETLTACVNTFCDEVAAAGYEPMVYFNQELTKTLLDLTQMTEYAWWLAMYSDRMDYPYKIRFWQYSDEGSVPGIAENVDLNLYFP